MSVTDKSTPFSSSTQLNKGQEYFQQMMRLVCFEPLTGALVACALEHSLVYHRVNVQRTRIWIRRHSRPILDATLEELTEPMLDMIPYVDLRTVLLSSLLLLLIHILLQKTEWKKRS